jgi:hypothetical protein
VGVGDPRPVQLPRPLGGTTGRLTSASAARRDGPTAPLLAKCSSRSWPVEVTERERRRDRDPTTVIEITDAFCG